MAVQASQELARSKAQYEEALNVYKEQRAEKRKRNVRNTRNDLLRVFSTDRASRAAADIKNITGVDTAGNQTVLESRMAEHILRRHGENGEADHSMRDINDIGRIQYVIDNYDSVVDGGTTQSYVTNVDGKNRPAKTVLFSKAVNGTYYVVEAVPDTTKHTTYIVTAYMTKNKPTGVQSADASAPTLTAKTEAGLPVGTATVPQAAPTVNPASPDGTKLSRTVETARDAGITPEPVKRDINTGIEDGKYRYIPESNDAAVLLLSQYGMKQGAQSRSAERRQQRGEHRPLPAAGLFFYRKQRRGAGRVQQRENHHAHRRFPCPAVGKQYAAHC